MIWVVCLAGTVYLFQPIPKAFLPVGDSAFMLGVLIGQEGASPEQMQRVPGQRRGRHARTIDAVEMTFTMTGHGAVPAVQPGLPARVPEGPEGHAPRRSTAGRPGSSMRRDMAARMPGAIGVLNPQPVLQISTGATATQTGQYAYTLSRRQPRARSTPPPGS